jgi:hypothetical protein
VRFVRFDVSGKVPVQLKAIEKELTAIAEQFQHQGKRPLRTFTVICIADRGEPWSLVSTDGPEMQRAVNYLFLAGVAVHQLYDQLSAPINSSYFARYDRYIGDGFVRHISRRRDGETWGVWSGEQTLVTAPPQVSQRTDIVFDESFLASLVRAEQDEAPIADRINLALPFFALANTDGSETSSSVEIILSASAFEQLLGSNGKALDLSEKFAKLFDSYGGVTAAEAAVARPGIVFNDSGEQYVEARKKWFSHQMWIYELHKARSKAAHKGTLASRTWGWEPLEHLVMANFTFPLAVKLLLAASSLYDLTPADESRCRAVDRLLMTHGWNTADAEWQASSLWTSIIRRAEYERDEAEAHNDFIRTLTENIRTLREIMPRDDFTDA